MLFFHLLKCFLICSLAILVNVEALYAEAASEVYHDMDLQKILKMAASKTPDQEKIKQKYLMRQSENEIALATVFFTRQL